MQATSNPTGLRRRGAHASANPILAAVPLALLAHVAFGCTSGPDYEPVEPTMPEAWSAERDESLTDEPVPTAAWWETFEDPTLDALVTRALAQNLDLRSSLIRLVAARTERGIAAADRLPQIDGNASYTYRDESQTTPFGAFIPRTDIHSATFDADWELDLWGRVRRNLEAADAELAASGYDVQAAALSVAAEVAASYIELRAAQRRLAIARTNLRLQEQTLELVQARLSSGLVGERDVAQAATNVESTRSRLPQLAAEATTARNRLVVLLGGPSQELPEDLAVEGELPTVPTSVAVGVPADLLRRRPDVHRAERQFAAAVARIGAASAERYPTFRLSGQIGLQSNVAKDFFESDSVVTGFGPSLRWNLFDGGRLKNRVAGLEAMAEASQVAYEQTVLLALEETENAMTRFVQERLRRESLARAATQARQAVDLARTQYREGLIDFQSVLDSERIAATVDDDLASSDAAIALHLIALYKALGGGMPEVELVAGVEPR